MTNNKTIHIIPHTHWDREWYLPYEKHHMKLVDLMDSLLETLKSEPEYKSFHLDGHTIILDDYLQVRPDKRAELQKHINEGRIHIGPWYILQDEFLTSSESNIRNLQYGMKDSKKWGNMLKSGYFPDSFGNMGQAPQILMQAGINNALFARGVKPTGFNNEVIESDSFESPYSEMYWRSPDGSKVYGILFANWYCNGNEIPVNEKEAVSYWDSQIEAMEKYAAGPHMLMMNGCDHQPIQTNLSEAIKTAQNLYPDITFKHSNFNDYVQNLTQTLPEDLKIVDGELRSQKTDGWGTLVNTASSRLYLKQMNRTGETILAKVAEPLETFAYMLGKPYNHQKLEYAWKKLMQNHAHDSICGCGVDEIHRGVVTRFADSKHVAESLVEESLTSITNHIDTTVFGDMDKAALPFVVYNTSGYGKSGTVSIILDVKRAYFADGVNKEALKSFDLGQKELVDASGNRFDFTMEDLGISFSYDLPEDKFRQTYMARRIKVTFEANDVPALGYRTYALISSENELDADKHSQSLVVSDNEMANEYLHVKMNGNGSLTITDKQTGKTFEQLGVYEDTGDIGNEYMYKQPDNEEPLTTKDALASIKLIEDKPYRAAFDITHDMTIPKSADELLEQEQREVVPFNIRKAQRTKETVSLTISTRVSLERNGKGVHVTAKFNNQAKDHRLRTLFPTGIETDHHHADSIFEVVKRPNEPAEEWSNPDNSQHQQDFVSVSNEEESLTIANYGLNEYEILRDDQNTIAVTLLRSVGEMGDWGHFPTPEAQCLGESIVSYAIYPSNGQTTDSYRKAYQYQIPWSTCQSAIQEGSLKEEGSFIDWQGDHLAFSSIKVSEATGDIMLRWFNLQSANDILQVNGPSEWSAYESNVIEEYVNKPVGQEQDKISIPASGHKIVTVGFKR
ncbi:alpha-mannosidase [Virgibacillus sp. NKC19-3]|uniref:alpha-mannosidase n=1 Tax=Virgibacillus saliphilus TaxID=2831674 RepID=UPI001C9B5684|nr:alpha-mannosidase [Virgibacillus sp. NKC19-3]MBY7142899.1 alpha-mannosidase [Virgibacillus sp. NKC19-3]